jgi:hypothetical protein
MTVLPEITRLSEEPFQTQQLRRWQAIYIQRNVVACSCNHSCSGQAIRITYSECVSVALGIQHAKRIRHVTLSSVAFLTLPHLQHYVLNDRIFEKKRKNYLDTKCVLWFSLYLFPETFFILRIIQPDIIINVHRSSCKVAVILVRFYWHLNFL